MADLYQFVDNNIINCTKSSQIFSILHNNYNQLWLVNEELFAQFYTETTGFFPVYRKVGIILSSAKHVQEKLLSLHRLKTGSEYNILREIDIAKLADYNSSAAIALHKFTRQNELWDIADVLLDIYQRGSTIEEGTHILLKIA